NFPDDLSNYAAGTLRRMGVDVLTSIKVTHCDAAGVSFGNDRLKTRTIMWAAGVEASPAAAWIGADHDRAGRIEVRPDLSVPGWPDIFAIGDTAAFLDAPGRPGAAPAPARPLA